jgi:hypothetical protein
MGTRRTRASIRLRGLAEQVEGHLEKLEREPAARAADHWKRELTSWMMQMRDLLPRLGRKTATEWGAKIRAWEGRMAGDLDE